VEIMATFTSYICRGPEGETEIEVEVEYRVMRAYKGARDSLGGVPNAGPPLEPDEEGGIELENVTDAAGVEYELTDLEYERFREEAETDFGYSCYCEDQDER
jgi:hypothetical protein